LESGTELKRVHPKFLVQGIEPAELASLQARLREREVELHYQRLESERLVPAVSKV